jgi:hypothetical protein
MSDLQALNCDIIAQLVELKQAKVQAEQEVQSMLQSKQQLVQQINQLNAKLSLLDTSLQKKQQLVKDHDKLIKQVEATYEKIVESSSGLLQIIKKEKSEIHS